MPDVYFAGAGAAPGAGEGEASGAGDALPAVAGAATGAGLAAAAALGLGARIDPADVDAAIEGFGHFWIHLSAKAGQAAEGRLDMTAGAAEPVIEIEMTERGVEVVSPHQ